MKKIILLLLLVPCVIKIHAQSNRAWATYYGGSGLEMGNYVATDANGNVYLVGNTNSTSDIASGGFQNVKGGYNDAFFYRL